MSYTGKTPTFDKLTLGKGDTDPADLVANVQGTDPDPALKPRLRFNQSTLKWEYSNDGVVFAEIGSGGGGGGGVERTINTFAGDSVEVAFTLSVAPLNEDYIDVFIGGVYQEKTEYSVAGSTLTFVAAPPNAVNVEVVITAAAAGTAGGKRTFELKLNGNYGNSAPINNVDGLWVAPADIRITNVYIYQDEAGSGGTTEIDLKVKPFGSGAFTSIFTTTPKVTSAAGSDEWCGIGDVVTGFTAPVLTSAPFVVPAKSAIRMDLITAQTGSPAGVGVVVEYEENI